MQYVTLTVKLLDWGEIGINTSTETAALRQSFRKEVSVWSKLEHPNVTKVYKLFNSYNYNILIINNLLFN